MKPLFWAIGIGIAISVAGVLYLLHNGYKVPAVKVMKPTTFERPEEIGAVLVRRYWTELHNEPVVILGQSPFLREGLGIWRGLLRTALHEGVKFDRYFVLSGLPALNDTVTFETYSAKAVAEALDAGQRVLIHHLATDEAVRELTAAYEKGLVLFQAPLPVRREDGGQLPMSCDRDVKDFQLGCAALNTARPYYRKKLPQDRLVVVLEKYVPLKQILFVHEP